MPAHSLTIIAEIVVAGAAYTDVRLTCGGHVAYVGFARGDLIRSGGTHRQRAEGYMAAVAGTRSLTQTLITLARAEIDWGPRRGIGLQFVATLAELSEDA